MMWLLPLSPQVLVLVGHILDYFLAIISVCDRREMLTIRWYN